jgi:hypothetical protein
LCKGSISSGIKTGAQIIYDVSQACGINPQVLIVLLQKEQSLITDDWPWSIQYRSATGYGCPDTAPCDSEYYGFFNQVYQAAKAFRRYEANPNGYNYKANRNNFILYNPNSACGGSNIFIQNQATANLYIYTPYQPNSAALNNLYGTGDSCSAYGNRNFWRMFNDWFGSTQLLPGECDSKVSGIACVWSIMKLDGTQFLTSSKAEVDLTTKTFGWMFEGVAFYASKTQRTGTIPTYRFQHTTNGQYYYTVDQSDVTISSNPSAWTDEGIAFYVYPSTTTTNISHKTYRMYNASLNQRYWTIDLNRKTYLTNIGYTLESSPFNTFSGRASLPIPAAERLIGYFYTTNLRELDSVIRMGYQYEGVLTTANSTSSGVPVYRLQRKNGYFYTASADERDNAIQSYGMVDEGIGFYLDTSSALIYRLANPETGKYLYTSNLGEVMSVANVSGWKYENALVNKNTNPAPVYRFLNLLNSKHFYTINIHEATRIANKGWKYETVAFNADTSTGLPVYRLLFHDKHFYTTDTNEKNMAVSKFGYTYEGVAFYANPTSTSKPVYRLQGTNEYFYTASSVERDKAVSKFGYTYEGVAFYLP